MVDAVANIRIAEDWILSFVVLVSFLLMVKAGIKLKGIPVGTTPWIAAAGLTPLLVWKLMGAYRRVFIDKAASPELYNFLHDWGEAFEAFSGLALAVVLIIIYKRNTSMLK